jgi:hypothetical protein
MDNGRILILTDSPRYYSARDLAKLYPGRVDEHDITKSPITAELLAPYGRVWTLVRRVENRGKFDYGPVRDHARKRGARVVSHLLEYADGAQLPFRFCDAGQTRHKLRIIATSDPITNGYAVGDRVYWYRNDTDIDEPPVGHYSYREIECDDTTARTVLARSESTGGAMWIEESFASGGKIFAADLFSPLELCFTQGDPYLLDRGTFNKYIPVGNLFGATVRYGRYLDSKLNVDDFYQRIHALAHLPGADYSVEVRDEGAGSGGRPILSLRFGNSDGPRFLLTSVKHGTEWENGYGMLLTLESLIRGELIDLERFGVVCVPLLNPFGYERGCRQNANGVDINRQLRKDWDDFRGWTDEVIEPWTFDFKGHAFASEPEAVIEQRLLQEGDLYCRLDAHSMANGTLFAGKAPDPGPVFAIGEIFAENFKDRYLLRGLCQQEVKQMALDQYPVAGANDDRGMFSRGVGESPYYDLLYESVGQLPDVHATLMQTDFTVELIRTIIQTVAAAAV